MQVRRRRYDRTVLVPGQELKGQDSYTVAETVGEGGYAIVYRAMSSKRVPVALKEFLPGTSVVEREQVRQLFLHERDVLWRLRSHPHLPDLVEAFAQDGMHYLVLEFVQGEALRERLDRAGAIEADEAGVLSLQLARAVASLHLNGIVHHDIKPGNVKIGPSGLAVLLDLGSARAVASDSAHLRPLVRTAEGYAVEAGPATQVAGTEGYMAPELRAMVSADCLQSDFTLDVFSLGCTIYEMVVGQRLSQDDIDTMNEAKLAQAVEEVADRSPVLAMPVARSLSICSDERYGSAQELLADLETIIPPQPAVVKEVLDFDMSPDGRGVELPLVIRNVGGGSLEGSVRSLHPAMSFVRRDGTRTREIAFRGNANVVRVLAESEQDSAAETKGTVEVRTDHGQVSVICRMRREYSGLVQLHASPHQLRLEVTRQTIQQALVKVRNKGQRGGEVCVETTRPDLVEVIPADVYLEPNGEAEFCIRPASATLPSGTSRVVVRFRVESGESQVSVEVTLRVRDGSPGGGRGLLRRGR